MIEKRELEKAMREWRKEVCFGNLDKKLKLKNIGKLK